MFIITKRKHTAILAERQAEIIGLRQCRENLTGEIVELREKLERMMAPLRAANAARTAAAKRKAKGGADV